MALVTLTTDYGLSDHFVGALKGQLLSQCSGIQLIDISHTVKNHDNIAAAFVVKNSAFTFPAKSLHFIIVNIKAGNNRYLIIEKDGHVFICPDNGIVSLMFPDQRFTAYVMPDLQPDFTYPELIKNFIGFYQTLKSGMTIDAFAKPTGSYLSQVNVQPIVTEDLIRGSVFYTDSFGNVVTNITGEMFQNMVGNKPFEVTFRSYRLKHLSKHYGEAPIGEFLCMINDAGYLEIAQNQGDIATLLDLRYGANVMVELQ